MQNKTEWKQFLIGAVAMTGLIVGTNVAYGKDASCEQIEEFSTSVMTARQKNVPMSVVIQNLRDVNSGEIPTMLKRIVVTAYQQPRYHGSEFQLETIQDFANDVYSECYASRMGGES